MRKQISLMLSMFLISVALTACGNKDNPEEESITRIEASNAAESKEPTERKYEDTTKEPVVAPDRNNSTESSEETTDTNETLNIDSTIYGSWNATDGSYLTIYNSSEGVQFNMYDIQLDKNIYGTIDTDESTFIEMTYTKPKEDKPEETIPQEAENTEEIDNTEVVYDSDEEMQAALDQAKKDSTETIKYTIDKIEFISETNEMHMVLSNSNRTLDLKSYIDNDTPDYSSENNPIVEDTVEAVPDETVTAE